MTKKDKILIKIQRDYQKDAGFFDGRFVEKIEETKKEKKNRKRIKKQQILKEIENE